MDIIEKTYTLNDLKGWDFPGTSLAVIGDPIGHSLSPLMHNAALKEMGINEPKFNNWRYFRFRIEAKELADAITLFHEKRFKGINITVPHKVGALELVWQVDDFSRQVGAINALTWAEEGFIGTNTDAQGLAIAIKKKLAIDLKEADIILLGAGGASRAAALIALEMGCREIWIGNRTEVTLNKLVEDLSSHPNEAAIRVFSLNEPDFSKLPSNALVINGTSVGLKAGDDEVLLDLSKLRDVRGVYDMVYNPAETALLKMAKELGLAFANGSSTLVEQGAIALAKWTGSPVPVETMNRVVEGALAKR